MLLIPGFLAGDPSLGRLSAWLRTGSFRTYRSGITVNVDCTEALVTRLERRLEQMAETAEHPAIVIGQSRGGVLGWVLAVRRPDLVGHLVTLGSPLQDQLAVFPRQWLGIGVVGLLGTVHVPGFFGWNCRSGKCCERARADLRSELPDGVRCTAVYSRNDRVVRWQACIPPQGDSFETSSTHIGMGLDVEVWRELSRRL